jgi:L-lactate permease
MLPPVTRTSMAIVAAFFGVAFAISGIVRGDAAPGVVGGALGALVVYLVLQRVQEQHEARRRRRQHEHQ